MKAAVMAVITRPKSCGRALMATSANSSIASEVGRKIAMELKYMNKTECLSSFTDASVKSMTSCSWENLLEEIQQCCPTLSKVFSAITKCKKHTDPTPTARGLYSKLRQRGNEMEEGIR